MLVVMTHSINVYQLDGLYWVQYLWVFIMTFTMPLFMMISGFWFKPRTLDYSLKHYHFRPGFCYGTGFMHVHGLSITGFVSKWLNFALCVALSISVIALMPNRKLPFSKYGSRTMTVYMLHMSIVFPLCWVLLRPVMFEWYGYVLYIVGVPFVCAFLFNEKVDSIMKVILSLPDRIFNKCR